MQGLNKNPMSSWTSQQRPLRRFSRSCANSVLILLLGFTLMLSACGSGSSTGGKQIPVVLSGNWQFSMSNTADVRAQSGLQGGFLLEKNGTVTGKVEYSITLAGQTVPCNSGTAPVTGKISGQTVTFTAVAGTQTFTFTGTATSNNLISTMAGSYTSTAGTATDGSPCGSATTLGWTATTVPPLQGFVEGNFHSTGGAAGLIERNFPVTGALTQGQNTGASNTTVTGNVSFVIPGNNVSDYPCLATASVSGQISGNAVVLQLNASDGSSLGQIGASGGGGLVQPVTLDSTSNGYLLHSLLGTAYAVTTKSCLGDTTSGTPGDFGYICLELGVTGACQQPINVVPAAISSPPLTVGTTSPAQNITIVNASGITLAGLTLTFTNNSPSGLQNFTIVKDGCDIPGNPLGSTFSLLGAQSCTIAVAFTPQEASAVTATLIVTSPQSADNNTAFAVPITGTGVGAMAASPEVDLGAEAISKASLPLLLSFTKHNWHPVQTLPGSSTRTFQDQEHHAEID